jgi:hypothetical protein
VSVVNDDFLDRLAAEAAPVRRVDARWFAAMVLAATAVSALIIGVGSGVRPDLPAVLATPVFLWKVGAMALVALVSLPLLAAAGRPGAGGQRLLPLAVALGTGLLGLPLIGAVMTQPAELSMQGLDMDRGLGCLKWTVAASVPVWLASLAWLRRSAPTNLARAAWAAGIASASVAATLFVMHCPYDDIVYVSLWYGGSVAFVAGVTRLLLPPLIRW